MVVKSFNKSKSFGKIVRSQFIRAHGELNCVASMGEIRGVVASETEEKFRRLAMKKFGYGKGSLSKALEAALLQWIQMNGFEDSYEPGH